MSIDIAADGGQTSLRLAIVDGGVPVEVAEGAGFRHEPGSESTTSFVATFVETYRRLEVHQPPRRICLGLTGAPPDDAGRRRLARAILEATGAAEVRLGPDLVTAHAGALGTGFGVVLAVGTGAVSLGIGPHGRSHRADGLGYLLGDDGSGFAIGRAALRAALRAQEGRGPATSLLDAALRRYADVPDFPSGLYATPNVVTAVASFTREVADAARSGDAVARAIWRDAVDRLATTTVSVLRQTFPDAAPDTVPVSWTGRLFEVRDLLLTPYRRTLARRCPAARLTSPVGTPLDGAARLAGAGLGPYRRLMQTVRRSDR